MADQKITQLTELTTPALEDLIALVDDPSGSPITKKATLMNVIGQLLANGWISANETWTYASATTFTISGDKTGKYQKGDKIKLTNSTVKYFYIVGVSYSSPNTTVTVTGGSDYTLASGTITDNYYSKVENPQGFPDWFNYTPTWSAGGSMTYTSVTSERARFCIQGTTVTVAIRGNGTTGGSADQFIYVTTPTNMFGDGYHSPHTGAYCYDGGYRAGVVGDTGVANKVWIGKYDASVWGLGTMKIAAATIIYELP